MIVQLIAGQVDRAARLGQHVLDVGRRCVADRSLDQISAAGAARQGLDHHIATDIDNVMVIARTARHRVAAGATVEQVVAAAAVEHIVAATAQQGVVASAPEQAVIAGIASQHVVATLAVQRVDADAAVHRIGAGRADIGISLALHLQRELPDGRQSLRIGCLQPQAADRAVDVFIQREAQCVRLCAGQHLTQAQCHTIQFDLSDRRQLDHGHAADHRFRIGRVQHIQSHLMLTRIQNGQLPVGTKARCIVDRRDEQVDRRFGRDAVCILGSEM